MEAMIDPAAAARAQTAMENSHTEIHRGLSDLKAGHSPEVVKAKLASAIAMLSQAMVLI